MFEKMRFTEPFNAAVLFPGDIPPEPQHWEALMEQGFTLVESDTMPENAEWSYSISHPDLGSGEMTRFPQVEPPTDIEIDFCVSLTDEEKESMKKYKAPVLYLAGGDDSAYPENRKKHFRILRAIMGDKAGFMVDGLSHWFWSRAALDDELAHDAELGIEALFILHLVDLDEKRFWLHSHGLFEMGLFDFDMVDLPPNAHILEDTSPATALAGHIMEGSISPTEKRFRIGEPGMDLSLVPGPEFNKVVGPQKAQELRPDHETEHDEGHSVVCDPAGGWLFKRKIRPCQWLRKEELGGIILNYSSAMTHLMETRARLTLGTLKRYSQLARDNELPITAKLGYETDSGMMEHLWFEVHELGDESVDATLINQPFDIAKMKKGDRGNYPLNRLTDWNVFTPFGCANPQCMRPFRALSELVKKS